MSPDSSLPEALARAQIPGPILEVVDRLRQGGYQAFLVGGCVRDLVAGRTPQDFDVATSAVPADVQAAFKRVIPTGIQHGTVTVVAKGHHVEVTTFRAEGAYVDGRRPTSVEFKVDIRDDLSRRDFTINAMAFDPVGRTLVDPFGGQDDLRARVIRAVGDPLARFSEDGLRCLRAARFAAVLGFSVEPATLAAIAPCVPVFRKVAKERTREELSKLLVSSNPEVGLGVLSSTGLLPEILPDLRADQVAADIVARAAPQLPVRLAALLHPVTVAAVQRVLRKLTFPNRTIDEVSALLQFPLVESGARWSDEAIRRWASAIGRGLVETALALDEAVSGTAQGEARARVLKVLHSNPPLTTRELALDGARIMEVLGLGPSPKIGEATRYLLDRVLARPELNQREILEEILSMWAKGDTA